MPLDATTETALVAYLARRVAEAADDAGRAVSGPATDDYLTTVTVDATPIAFYRGRSPEDIILPAVIVEVTGSEEDPDARGNHVLRVQVSLMHGAEDSELTPDALEHANRIAAWLRDIMQEDTFCDDLNVDHHGGFTLIGLIDSQRQSLRDGRMWMAQWSLSFYAAETDLVTPAPV